LSHLKQPGLLTVNLGTGNGSSVLEVIRTFEAVSGRSVPYEIGERRAGDVAICYADSTLAGEALGWKSSPSLPQMCADHWRWQLKKPAGYRRSNFWSIGSDQAFLPFVLEVLLPLIAIKLCRRAN
jgi:UDP-glucose 4-epimerase